MLDVQQLTRQCEAFTVSGKQEGRWQLNSKTKRTLCCLLAKASWWIKCNYNQSCKSADKYKLEHENISLNPKSDLKPNQAQKAQK